MRADLPRPQARPLEIAVAEEGPEDIYGDPDSVEGKSRRVSALLERADRLAAHIRAALTTPLASARPGTETKAEAPELIDINEENEDMEKLKMGLEMEFVSASSFSFCPSPS